MIRIKLIVAYDGTNYCGWQIQNNGITVEEVLNRELSALLREDIQVIGASRTDSGVHALGNVAVFDTETRIPPEKISFALNQRLPEDIRIQNSCQVADDFHPRFCDTVKTYEYKIWNSRFLTLWYACIPNSFIIILTLTGCRKLRIIWWVSMILSLSAQQELRLRILSAQ